jgi:beta-glucosidase
MLVTDGETKPLRCPQPLSVPYCVFLLDRYNAKNVKPLFSFGHGLGYSKFDYSNVRVQYISVSPSPLDIRVSFDVANTGDVEAREVTQLYLTFPDAAGEPPRQLKGFQKISLRPDEIKRVTILLTDRSFSIWSVDLHKWTVVPGDYSVEVGASVADVRLHETVSIFA